MTVRPFEIRIPDEALDDLRRRLGAIRWPASLDDESWEDGASLSFLRRLAGHWLRGFDWRAQEQRLNRLPQYLMNVEGLDIHFIHQRGVGPAPMPLVLTHGWPGSFVEFEHILPLLTNPGAHGGDPTDAFHVVAPSLPGYGFSPAPTRSGISTREIAGLWRALMAGLGYEKFGAQGGDHGAGVSIWLGRLFPESLSGIHLNFISGSYRPALDTPITPEEQAFLDRTATWVAAEGAYALLHATKPRTLAFSLSDSPIGLAAWIVEKFRSWSDCGGDVERCFSMDALLTDISLYWFGDALEASLRLYKENRRQPLVFASGERVIPPLGMAAFPHEIYMPPRSWVERVFDVRRWAEMPAGGHFAALEQPELLAAEIRAFFRPLRAAAAS